MRLKSTYLGLELDNPLVVAASPLTRDLDMVRRLEDAGAPAFVMYSLFEEELDMDEEAVQFYRTYGTEAYGEALDYFPKVGTYTKGPDEYLEQIRRIKEAVDVPVIASLNGISGGGWTQFGSMVEEAGADALELNVYFIPAEVTLTGGEVEKTYQEVVREVCSSVTIPVAVKLSPYFSSLGHLAGSLVDEGAKGLVMFNRFYQPDIDLERLEVRPAIVLSSSVETRLAMRWIAILRGEIETSFAASSGIHTAEDVLKLVMAGADVTMLCSALLKYGAGHLTQILADLVTWCDEHDYESLEQMRGSMSYGKCPFPSLYERANYMKTLQSWS